MGGNLFDSAIMKTSVIGEEFRRRYLSEPSTPNAFVTRAVVFEGPEDYHQRIDDPALDIDERCILVMRYTGPIGYPGSAEVVNMQPPAALIKRGITALPTLGDGRQSGTSDAPSILNASPEAAAGGNLASLETGDRIRVDLTHRSRGRFAQRRRARRASQVAPAAAAPEPDTVAGALSLHRGPARHRRLHGARSQVPGRRAQGLAARLTLTE